MRKLQSLWATLLVAFFLVACAVFGTDPGTQLVAGYQTNAAARSTAALLLKQGHLKKSEGTAVLQITDQARVLLDVAREDKKVCDEKKAAAKTDEERRLIAAGCESNILTNVGLAQKVLDSIEQYLSKREVTK